MEGNVWRRATLRVGMGGIGLRLASELALPAYLAGLFSGLLRLRPGAGNVEC